MNKKLMIGIGAGLGLFAAVAASKKCPPPPSSDMWARMREKMEEMPADFPPRVMFDNVEATKANTDEILSLLRQQGSTPTADALTTT